MKRKICFGLAAVMLMSSLAGCGGDKKTSTSENGVDTITLQTNNSHSKSIVQELANEWNNTTGKEKGIKIDYVVKGDDYAQSSLPLPIMPTICRIFSCKEVPQWQQKEKL